MEYGEIIRRAWKITWNHKGLWLLGILAGCSGGNGNPSQTTSYQISNGDLSRWPPNWVGVSPETWTLIVVALVVVIFIVVIAFIVLGLLGQAGLIAGFSQADETGSVTLGQAWRGGLPHFWRLLGLGLLLLGVALIIGIAIAVFGVITLGIGVLCLLPLLCLALPLGVVVAGYLNLVQNGIVVDGMGVFEALRRGWEILKRDFWPVVVMTLILFGIGLVAGIALSVPLFVAALPLLAAAMAQQGDLTRLVPLLGCLVLYLPVMIVASGVLKTFTSGAWTLTYRRLTGRMAGPDALKGEAIPAPA